MNNIIFWEQRKKFGFFFSLFNTLKNSFSQKKDFSQEITMNNGIYNPILYAFSILLISNTFLILTYLVISFDSLYKLFSFLQNQNVIYSKISFKTFFFLFPILESILAILSIFIFCIFFKLFFDLVDKKKVLFPLIIRIVYYSKGSYILFSFIGIFPKLLGIFFSFYLIYFFSLNLIKKSKFIILLGIILSFMTHLFPIYIVKAYLQIFFK